MILKSVNLKIKCHTKAKTGADLSIYHNPFLFNTLYFGFKQVLGSTLLKNTFHKNRFHLIVKLYSTKN